MTFLNVLSCFIKEAILLLNDGFGGGFQPLLRNISGGYKQLSYTGLGRILQYGMGIRYFASSGEIKSASICSGNLNKNLNLGYLIFFRTNWR